jgi:hypothetical protein
MSWAYRRNGNCGLGEQGTDLTGRPHVFEPDVVAAKRSVDQELQLSFYNSIDEM